MADISNAFFCWTKELQIVRVYYDSTQIFRQEISYKDISDFTDILPAIYLAELAWVFGISVPSTAAAAAGSANHGLEALFDVVLVHYLTAIGKRRRLNFNEFSEWIIALVFHANFECFIERLSLNRRLLCELNVNLTFASARLAAFLVEGFSKESEEDKDLSKRRVADRFGDNQGEDRQDPANWRYTKFTGKVIEIVFFLFGVATITGIRRALDLIY